VAATAAVPPHGTEESVYKSPNHYVYLPRLDLPSALELEVFGKKV
jgi:hypothetical protein